MKIYRVWSDSNHTVQYTLGYYLDKKKAEEDLEKWVGWNRTGASPADGIEEIYVIGETIDNK